MFSLRSFIPKPLARSKAARSVGNCPTTTRAGATKRPSQLLPPTEDKAVQCLVETGIRGSLAMLAVTALQLDVFSHVHWRLHDVMTGLQLAAPCAAIDAALLVLFMTLSGPQSQPQPNPASTDTTTATADAAAAQSTQQQQSDRAAARAAVLGALDAVYLHSIRYSLMGATAPRARLALEAGAQLSEELLARGALLGCASLWLTNRFVQASVCGDTPLLAPLTTLGSSSADAATAAALMPCGTAPEWLAAGGLCAIMASRFVVHSKGRAAATRSEREAAAAEAAARRAVLRYEPLAVQQAAAAAAGGELQGETEAELAVSLAAAEADAVERWAQGYLGARFVIGQASMFGAYIATDNLLASFTAGLVLQVVAGWCCEKYLQRVTATA